MFDFWTVWAQHVSIKTVQVLQPRTFAKKKTVQTQASGREGLRVCGRIPLLCTPEPKNATPEIKVKNGDEMGDRKIVCMLKNWLVLSVLLWLLFFCRKKHFSLMLTAKGNDKQDCMRWGEYLFFYLKWSCIVFFFCQNNFHFFFLFLFFFIRFFFLSSHPYSPPHANKVMKGGHPGPRGKKRFFKQTKLYKNPFLNTFFFSPPGSIRIRRSTLFFPLPRPKIEVSKKQKKKAHPFPTPPLFLQHA